MTPVPGSPQRLTGSSQSCHPVVIRSRPAPPATCRLSSSVPLFHPNLHPTRGSNFTCPYSRAYVDIQIPILPLVHIPVCSPTQSNSPYLSHSFSFFSRSRRLAWPLDSFLHNFALLRPSLRSPLPSSSRHSPLSPHTSERTGRRSSAVHNSTLSRSPLLPSSHPPILPPLSPLSPPIEPPGR